MDADVVYFGTASGTHTETAIGQGMSGSTELLSSHVKESVGDTIGSFEAAKGRPRLGIRCAMTPTTHARCRSVAASSPP